MKDTTTLRDILSLPRFSELILLTNEKNAAIPIKNVEISETPDIANYTYSHSFILTTAMIYKDDQSKLKELIDSLLEIKATGLGIKVGRFIDAIDPEIINYADKNNFCLVQIPETLPLGGVLQQISDFINHTKTKELSYALDIQKHFSNLMINDSSLSKITTEFSKKVKCPVILIDPFRNIVAFSNKYHQLKVKPEKVIHMLSKKNVFSSHMNASSSTIELDERTYVEVATYPIKNNSFFPYYLIIIDPKNIPYPISEFTIDQALLVLSFVLLKNDKINESKKQIKSDYFNNILERQTNEQINEMNWSSYDKNFGIQLSQFYQIILVSFDMRQDDSIKMKLNEEKMKLAYQWLENKSHHFFKEPIIFFEKKTNHLILMLQHEISQKDLTSSLKEMSRQLRYVLPIDLTFYCGQPCSTIDLIATSLLEAKILFSDEQKNVTSNSVFFYRPKGILNLFENVPYEEINYFSRNILKELAFPTEHLYVELRKTLKTFLNNQCEITKTANDLFIHRNTVKYRIDKCTELLGINLTSPENSLNIRLALELSDK